MFTRRLRFIGRCLVTVSALVALGASLPAAAGNDEVGLRTGDHTGDRDSRERDSNPLLRGLRPWGRVGAALPDGGELVTQARFLELLRAGGTLPYPPPAEGEDRDDGHAGHGHADALHERTIREFLARHPDLLDLKRILDNPPVPGRRSTPNVNGTWTIQPDGVGHPVETMGRSSLLSWIYDSVQFAGDRAGHLSLYRQLYDGLAARSDSADGGALARILNELPTPDSLGDASLASINDVLTQLGTRAGSIYALVPLNLGPRLEGCDAEIGASPRTSNNYGDRSGDEPYCLVDPNGVYAKVDFLNKNYPTCVKDQGARGTCHTFAVASATEERYSLDHGLKVNLSEQDEMEHYRLNWQRAIYDDAGDAWEEINDIISLNYVYPLERQWDYNPSYGRDTSTTPFAHSCDAVTGEPCSDNSPQAAIACANFGDFTLCILYDPGVRGSRYRATVANYFWDSSNPELSAEWMLLQLAFNQTVVMSFTVSPAFMSPRNGFVPYSAADLAAKPVGGHAVHVVSFITNEDLARAVPNAPRSSGPGFFVIKNSWSTCYGDSGYVYLPWEYVKAQTVQAFSISQVN